MTHVGTGVTWPRLINSCTNRRGPAKHQVGPHKATSWSCCRIYLYEDRVGGGVAPPPLTPPDMRARIRRFVKPFGRDAARSC